MKKINLFFTILIMVFMNELFSQQAGDLDNTFDADGKLTTDIGGGNDEAWSVAIQSNGKIVVAGFSNNGTDDDFAVARYNADGTLDNSFSSDGLVTTDFGGVWGDKAYAIVIQSNGKIVVAGAGSDATITSGFAVVRYNTDGTLDNSFSTDGMLITDFGFSHSGEIYALALQTDGKIVVAGYSNSNGYDDFTLARYNTDGSLDNSFSTDGIETTSFGGNSEARSIAIQTDGKIVAAGTFDPIYNPVFAIARYNTDGTLDNNFGTNGGLTTPFGTNGSEGWSVAIQSNGKIIVAGGYLDFTLARYNTDGTLDNNFSLDGKVTTDFGFGGSGNGENAHSVLIQPDGKIIAVGLSSSDTEIYFALARYNTDGTLDNSFSTDGLVTTDLGISNWAKAAALQSNGRIVVAGRSSLGSNRDFALARYISSLNVGIADFSLTENVMIYPNPIQGNITIEYTLVQEEILSIGLFDVSGRLIIPLIISENRNKGAHKEYLDLGKALISGNYILTISNGSGSMSVKVTKQ